MGLINAFATLKKYGINAETMENVVEQNSGEAVNVLHNRRGLFALLQQVELLCAQVRKMLAYQEVIDRIPMFCRIVREYMNGTCSMFPKKSMIMIVVGLLYFVNPCDIISDYIPFLGLLDDGFIISLIWNALEWDIRKYEESILDK